MLELGLFMHLVSDTAISSIVEERVYPLIQPQNGVLPCIVYSRVGAVRSQTLCGTDGKVRAVIQVDSYDKSYLGVKQLADVVRRTLIDFAGFMGNTRVDTVSLDTENDLDDPEPGYYRVSQTFFIWYLEE